MSASDLDYLVEEWFRHIKDGLTQEQALEAMEDIMGNYTLNDILKHTR